MNAVSIGFITGVMIAAVLLVFIFKYANRGKVRTEYDERQKAVRGKAYRYAFYTVVLSAGAVMWLMMTDINLPIEDYALIFIAIIAGCTVLATYCIWNDVYWGLNNDHRRYHIIFVIAIVLNTFPVVMQALDGSLMENGKLGMPLLNIVVLIMMVIVYGELIIKHVIDKKTGGED